MKFKAVDCDEVVRLDVISSAVEKSNLIKFSAIRSTSFAALSMTQLEYPVISNTKFIFRRISDGRFLLPDQKSDKECRF